MKKFKWAKVHECYFAFYGKEKLGYIQYWKAGKKWVWNQSLDVIMSANCLEEVIDKLKELKE